MLGARFLSSKLLDNWRFDIVNSPTLTYFAQLPADHPSLPLYWIFAFNGANVYQSLTEPPDTDAYDRHYYETGGYRYTESKSAFSGIYHKVCRTKTGQVPYGETE